MQAPPRAAVVLAAGASSRMGLPKADLPFASRIPAREEPAPGDRYTFLSRVVDLARGGCGRGPLVVVGRPHTPQPASSDRVAWVVNPHPERGMFSSIRVGLRFVSEPAGPPDHTMLLLVDHPLVQHRTVARLWAAADGDRVVVPTYGGRPGHPVVLPAPAVRLALEAEAEARLDRLLQSFPMTEVAVGDPGVVRDIDTPARYARFFGPLP